MLYEFHIARRLSFASGGRRSSPAVRVATLAVALSVLVMMAAIAIVEGFKKEITDRVAGFNSHISVYAQRTPDADNNIITLSPNLRHTLDSTDGVSSYALQAVAPAVLKSVDDFKGVYLKSLADSASSAFIASNIIAGEMPDFAADSSMMKTVVSDIASRQLGLKPGDHIDTYFITDEIRVRRLEVAGVYNTHFDTYDDVFIYGSLPLVQQLGGLRPDQATSLQVTASDFSLVPALSQELSDKFVAGMANGSLPRLFRVENAITQGAGYFRWLSLLDTNVTVILTLMTIVACVTLVSGMLIIILDKKRFIGLMKALGMTNRSLRTIFISLAMRVALYGIIAGTAIGGGLLWAQHSTHFIPLDPDSYYIDFVPVDISWITVLLLDAAVMAVALIVLLIPSSFVARISPSETMRGE